MKCVILGDEVSKFDVVWTESATKCVTQDRHITPGWIYHITLSSTKGLA